MFTVVTLCVTLLCNVSTNENVNGSVYETNLLLVIIAGTTASLDEGDTQLGIQLET